MPAPVLPPISDDWKVWGRNLSTFLSRSLTKLFYKSSDDIPSDNGIILWDEVNGYPVVSKGNEFRQIIISGGYANFENDSDITAVSADTAYAITYDAPTVNNGIDRADSPNQSRIVIDEGGVFKASFSAQVVRTSGTITFYFWLRKNGTTVIDGSSGIITLQGNADPKVFSKDCIFTSEDGDYIEAMWATSSTNSRLEATAATAFSPLSSSTTLTIQRVMG